VYLQVLDIAMRYHAAAGSLSIGRSLYDEKAPLILPIDALCEIWKGRYQVCSHDGSQPIRAWLAG
jgi:hypothetical protein